MSDEIETTETTTAIETPSTEKSPEVTSSENEKTPVGVFAPKTPEVVKEQIPGKNITQKLKPASPVVEKVVPPAYVPNHKFKVLDQEKEFDEWIKPFVKTKEEEEKFRDLLTKAHGLVKIKTERDQLRGEYDQYKTQINKNYEPVVNQFKYLDSVAGQSRQSGDWGKFFQAAQIPVQSVIRWAANTVSQLEKDPNYLQREESTWQQDQKFRHLETEHLTLKQQAEKLQTERQEMELDFTLRTPEVQNFSQMFDGQVGKPGALKQEIIRRGALIEMTEGRVASAQEILGEISKIYGPLLQAKAQAPQMQILPGGTQEAETGSEGKPVLPTIKGRSTSPARKLFKSTDDLRKHIKENYSVG